MNNLQRTEEIIAMSTELIQELELSRTNNYIEIIDMTNQLLEKLKELKKSLEE